MSLDKGHVLITERPDSGEVMKICSAVWNVMMGFPHSVILLSGLMEGLR
jgi:hypothetical protein